MKDVSKSTLGPGSSFHMLQGLHIKTWEIAHHYIFAINHQSTAIIYSLRCGPEIQLSHISRENTSGVAAPPIFSSAWLPTAFFGYATWQTLGLPSFFFAFAIFSEWNPEVFLEALLVCMWHQLIEGPSFFRMSALVHPHQTNSLKSHFLIPQSLPSEVFSNNILSRAKLLEWGTFGLLAWSRIIAIGKRPVSESQLKKSKLFNHQIKKLNITTLQSSNAIKKTELKSLL